MLKRKPIGWHIKETNEGTFYIIGYGASRIAFIDDVAVCFDNDTRDFVISAFLSPYGFGTAAEAINKYYSLKEADTLFNFNVATRTGFTKLDIT